MESKETVKKSMVLPNMEIILNTDFSPLNPKTTPSIGVIIIGAKNKYPNHSNPVKYELPVGEYRLPTIYASNVHPIVPKKQ
ncbi:hypothetical protein AB9M62_58265 [Bacillales bacterium AN1005]|mgnify:CR=1 FL=1